MLLQSMLLKPGDKLFCVLAFKFVAWSVRYVVHKALMNFRHLAKTTSNAEMFCLYWLLHCRTFYFAGMKFGDMT